MLCEGHVRWLQAHTLYFLQLVCISAAIYTKFPIFVLASFLRFFFFFFFEQDGYQVKVAFVSNRFENLLENIVFLDGIQLKTQNAAFKSFTDD